MFTVFFCNKDYLLFKVLVEMACPQCLLLVVFKRHFYYILALALPSIVGWHLSQIHE
jgi:hypothetical protein